MSGSRPESLWKRVGAGVRQRGAWRGAIPHRVHHTNQSSAAGRPQQLTHGCMQTLTQRFLLSCTHCSVNTAHIITLRKWPLTPVSLPSWFPHIQVSAVTHGHTDHGHCEAGSNHTHKDRFQCIQLTLTYLHLVHLVNTSCSWSFSPTDTHHTIIRNTHTPVAPASCVKSLCAGFLFWVSSSYHHTELCTGQPVMWNQALMLSHLIHHGWKMSLTLLNLKASFVKASCLDIKMTIDSIDVR